MSQGNGEGKMLKCEFGLQGACFVVENRAKATELGGNTALDDTV